jgi:hypothetical protein
MSPQVRVPVMVPAPATDRGRRIVRHRRLAVQDGALVLQHEDGEHEVLAAPGEVVVATWVPVTAGRPEAVVRETLELTLRDGTVLAVPLDDWLGTDCRPIPATARDGHWCRWTRPAARRCASAERARWLRRSACRCARHRHRR